MSARLPPTESPPDTSVSATGPTSLFHNSEHPQRLRHLAVSLAHQQLALQPRQHGAGALQPSDPPSISASFRSIDAANASAPTIPASESVSALRISFVE